MKKKFLLLIATCLFLICIGCATVSKEENRKNQEKVYSIQPGDTFAKIAQMHNLSIEELVEMNPNKDPRRLYIGEPIKVSK
ncbi:MAG: LysM repeat protein [Lentimonas sp.]|jgi:LysM repeat protein